MHDSPPCPVHSQHFAHSGGPDGMRRLYIIAACLFLFGGALAAPALLQYRGMPLWLAVILLVPACGFLGGAAAMIFIIRKERRPRVCGCRPLPPGSFGGTAD